MTGAFLMWGERPGALASAGPVGLCAVGHLVSRHGNPAVS